MGRAIELLNAIRAGHERMVAATVRLDWAMLDDEWQAMSGQFLELERMLPDRLAQNERGEARHLIEQILTLQGSVSTHAEPWMEQVKPLLEVFAKYPVGSAKTHS